MNESDSSSSAEAEAWEFLNMYRKSSREGFDEEEQKLLTEIESLSKIVDDEKLNGIYSRPDGEPTPVQYKLHHARKYLEYNRRDRMAFEKFCESEDSEIEMCGGILEYNDYLDKISEPEFWVSVAKGVLAGVKQAQSDDRKLRRKLK